jgi:hypothetical protein
MNKKLSQLSEKVTSLSADDLLLVSAGGVSKSIKASTLEAPLKAYADQKKSEVISELSSLDSALSSEVTNRQTADTNTLNSAKSYTDSEISSEISARNSADVTTLNSAKSYTDSEIDSVEGAILAEETSRIADIAALSDDLAEEVNTRIAADNTTLMTAQSYTEGRIIGFVKTPVGVIHMYVGSSAPSGWLLCDGSAVSRSTYAVLFALIGVSYGSGDGSTTFNIPSPDTNANLRLIIKF